MTRKCPNCGELVPDFSLTCPKCFKSIPRDDEIGKNESYTINDEKPIRRENFNRKVTLFLAFVPSLVGIMGLGQIYQRRYRMGLIFLLVGLFFFGMVALGISIALQGGGWIILAIAMLMIFVPLLFITYLMQGLDACARIIIKF